MADQTITHPITHRDIARGEVRIIIYGTLETAYLMLRTISDLDRTESITGDILVSVSGDVENIADLMSEAQQKAKDAGITDPALFREMKKAD